MSERDYPFSLERLVRRISVVAQAEAEPAVQSKNRSPENQHGTQKQKENFDSPKLRSESVGGPGTSNNDNQITYSLNQPSYLDFRMSNGTDTDHDGPTVTGSSGIGALDIDTDESRRHLDASTAEQLRSSIFNSMSMVSPAITPGDSPRSDSLRGSEIDLTQSVSSFSSATSLSNDSPDHVHEHGNESSSSSEAHQHSKHHNHHHNNHHHKDATLKKGHDKDLVKQSLMEELPQVFCESRARIPTTNGTEIFLHLYRNNIDAKEHLAIVFGQDIYSKTLFAPREGETEQDRMTRGAYVGRLYPGRQRSDEDNAAKLTGHDDSEDSNQQQQNQKDTLVRIHSECYTGETAWSARCDCGEQLDEAARLMSQEGRGVIVYLRQEGRGIGLGEKLKAYNLQDLGADTVTANLMLRHPADARSFGLATAILLDLGLTKIRLLTNNPDKIVAVEGKDKLITVTKRVPMIPLSWQNKGGFKSKEVDQYLRTKVERMGHMLDLQ